MVQHIVLFRLSDKLKGAALEAHLLRVKEDFEALPRLIEPLKALSIKINVNKQEKYHFLLEAQLETLDDVEVYAHHPAHTTLVAALIRPYLADRACVDVLV